MSLLYRGHYFCEPLYPAVSCSAEECKNSGFSARPTSYASVFIALLGSQWMHVLRQLRKRFDVIFYGLLYLAVTFSVRRQRST